MKLTCDITKADFKECASCAAKTGSPELCPSCLFNRSLVNLLQRKIDKMITKESVIKLMWKEEYLMSDIEQPLIKPTHGSCCTCQTCGNCYDACVCEHNDLIKKIEEL